MCVLTAEDTQNVIAALPPQQVIYFQASVDNQNLTLDASTGNNYTITFPLPLPAQAFWSLTLYNATSLNLIVNPINRYNINDRVSSLSFLAPFLKGYNKSLTSFDNRCHDKVQYSTVIAMYSSVIDLPVATHQP